MRISFLGAAREVTGSSYLLEDAGVRFLVDCGMFQGGREAYAKNLDALRFDLVRLDFVLITHAHLDHSGLLPRLSALGYRGPIYATPATVDLLHVVLLDSAYIQEKEAEWQRKREHERHARRHTQRTPLYTVSEAQAVLRQLRAVDYEEEFSPHAQVRVRFHDAGHILGSSIIELTVHNGAEMRRWVFSGDLGQPGRPVLRDPEIVHDADVLFVESTYGNRLHKALRETEDELVGILRTTLEGRRGNVIMPAFSVGRTQEVLFVLADLVRRERVGQLDIYVDSPMALAATELTVKHRLLLDRETQALMAWQTGHGERFRVRFIEQVDESIALNRIEGGAIIISASGMCDAGRIKYHLANNLPRSSAAVVITGFQAAGTLGRRLVDGARWVRIFGEPVAVHARIHTVGGLSAHADRDALLGWLRNFARPPAYTFVVHGEAETAVGFAETIRRELGWREISVPGPGDQIQV